MDGDNLNGALPWQLTYSNITLNGIIYNIAARSANRKAVIATACCNNFFGETQGEVFMITQEILKEELTYSPFLGLFTSNKKSGNRARGCECGSKWKSRGGKTYIQISVKNKKYYAHRLAALYMTGEFPKNEIDHDDGDGTNNKWDNLNLTTHNENGKNTRLKSNNTSGHNGVLWNESNKKWRARIMVDGKQKHFGYFKNKKDAANAVEQNKLKLGFNKNHGQNRPL